MTVSGPGGYSETTTYSGDDIESVEGVEVPGVGAYTADVHLLDAAGNSLPANKASVPLKFDDTVPVKSEPENANGWISRSELARVRAGRGASRAPCKSRLPGSPDTGRPSMRSPDTDPCHGAADPRSCGGPVTEVGINNTGGTLDADDLVEGANFVHVVPVSGSGMRATVRRPDLPQGRPDRSGDRARPAPRSGWVNHAAELEVMASDPLSGMVDTDEYPDDAPPRTVLVVDGDVMEEFDGTSRRRSRPRASITSSTGHGTWPETRTTARAITRSPGEATVRIDATAPTVAFANAQNPEDPDRLEATSHDALSGVASGSIEYRRDDDPSGPRSPTDCDRRPPGRSGRLERSRAGVRYEFRARAADAAGNVSISTQREDGTAMAVVGPFRQPGSRSRA